MSLFGSLSMAARALDAQRAGLAVTGQNMANLNTEGYVRRSIDLTEGPPGYGGVDVQGTRALRDAILDRRLRQELPAGARESAIGSSLAVVETALGAPGQSLDAQLTAFFDAFASLAQDPSSPMTRDSVVLQGRLLTRSFNDIAARLSDAQRAADTQVRSTIEQISALAGQIASANAAIATANGADTEGLKDQQSVALNKLSEMAGVSVLYRADGGVDVSIGGGRALVMGATVYALTATDQPPNGYAAATTGGIDITAEITQGSLSGQLDVRDTNIPGYSTRLDTMAFTLVQQVNALHQTGTDLNGDVVQKFFASIGAVAGAATAMTMDPAVSADPDLVAASLTGAPGDNQVAKDIAALRDARVVNGNATFSESWGQLVYRVGSDVQTAQVQQKTRQEIVDQISKLRDQISGVSLDEEAATMLRFQRAYEANAKYFAAVDQMLATLMQLANV